MSWSATQYVMFEDERTRPVRDLVNAISGKAARRVVDLGCGPGNSTEILAERFPGVAIAGVDSSADMIAAARKRLPQVQFEVGDIVTWNAPGPFDVLLANAALHHVPDHASLLPRLVGKLAKGGSLAVQMPDNDEEPARRLMRDVAGEARWADKLANADSARTTVRSAEWYYDLLRPHCQKLDVWRTTYFHPLSGGADAIVEWFKGSGLRPFLDPLDQNERAGYLDRYRAAVARAYPALSDGTTLLPFPRLFIVATR